MEQLVKHWRVGIEVLLLLMVVIIAIISTRSDWRKRHYSIHGIDVSHYQGDIDFDVLGGDPHVDFVFIKATEGRSLVDRKFKINWQQLHEQQIPCGAYHFYRPAVSAKWQARLFIKNVQLKKGDLPPVLDLEVTNRRSKATILKGVKIWLETIEAHYGVQPIIYVNQDYYKNYIKGNFEDYPIWIAAYRYGKPNLPERAWQFWQYSDNGRAKGIEGAVDRNVFNGNRRAFEALRY